jgi:NarL family two-component system sensor histidine kinase LiaS
MSVEKLLPANTDLIRHALAGRPDSRVDAIPQGRGGAATETVWSREKQIIGAVYVEMPRILPDINGLLDFVGVWFKSGLAWLIVTVPIGAIFGGMTTRALVQRIQRLVTATTRFANGHYAQRVQITRHDEVGHLEQQFNRMAEQLVESITQRQTLAEQNARLEERARISRDLHDSVKQRVFATAMQVSAALSLLDHKQEAAYQPLREAETLTYEVQQELTALIQELRPSELQDKGIAQALQEYVTNWSRQHGIKADLQLATTCKLPQAIAEAILRVTQEALSNIARHSQASTVQLRLTCEDGQILLAIRDNGQGFATASIQNAGIGLHSMQERMQALGGTITIESHMGQGTYLEARCACPHV